MAISTTSRGRSSTRCSKGTRFTDTWLALRPREPGYTGHCFDADLSNREAHCQERIDFIFERGFATEKGLRGTEVRIGVLPWERAEGPAGRIWPSDHAGLVGEFLVPGR